MAAIVEEVSSLVFLWVVVAATHSRVAGMIHVSFGPVDNVGYLDVETIPFQRDNAHERRSVADGFVVHLARALVLSCGQ